MSIQQSNVVNDLRNWVDTLWYSREGQNLFGKYAPLWNLLYSGARNWLLSDLQKVIGNYQDAKYNLLGKRIEDGTATSEEKRKYYERYALKNPEWGKHLDSGTYTPEEFNLYTDLVSNQFDDKLNLNKKITYGEKLNSSELTRYNKYYPDQGKTFNTSLELPKYNPEPLKLNTPELNFSGQTLTPTDFSGTTSSIFDLNKSVQDLSIKTPELKLNQDSSGLKFDTDFGKSNTNSGSTTLTRSTVNNAIASGIGSAVGMGANWGLGKLGNATGATKTLGGQFLYGTASNLASLTIGNAATNVASSVINRTSGSLGLSALNGAKGAFSGSAMGLFGLSTANLALDVFDPVKKSKWESGVNLGLGLASTAFSALAPTLGLAAAAGPVGWAVGAGLLAFNGIGHLTGKKLGSYTADRDLLSQTGNSYTGFTQKSLAAEKESGTKFSGYNTGGFNRAWGRLQDVKQQSWMVNNVINDSNDRFNAALNMTGFNSTDYNLDRSGGYDQRYATSAKNGAKLNLIKAKLVLDSKVKKYQEGGELPKQRTLDELIEYAKLVNPRFIQRMSEPVRYVSTEDGPATHLMSWADNPDGSAFVYSLVQEDENGALKVYSNEEAIKRAEEFGDYLTMTPEEASLFTEANNSNSGYKKGWPEFFKYFEEPKQIEEHKTGGIIELVKPLTEIELIKPITEIQLVNFDSITEFKEGGIIEQQSSTIELIIPDLIEAFKEGGEINVIPDGALHARKNNMDMEGITKKGIPVIDMNGDQQAEIEHSEIIFRLEVTKKLEELYKKYNDSESSKKDKDEYALEAGKLLVQEILYNTTDNTNNLL